MENRRDYFKVVGLILFVVSFSWWCAMTLIRISATLITQKTFTDYLDHSFYEMLPDSSNCTFSGAAPYRDHRSRLIYRDVPHIPDMMETYQERPIMLFGASASRDILTDADLANTNIINFSMPVATPLEYEALLNYLESEYQVLSSDYEGGAVIIFLSSIIYDFKDLDALHFMREFGAFEVHNQANKLEIVTMPDPFGLSRSNIATTNWNLFLTLYLPAWSQIQLNDTVPLGDRLGLPRIGLPICRARTIQERDDTLQDTINRYFASFELRSIQTDALERIAVQLESYDMPLIIVHFPVIGSIYASEYHTIYMNYMNEFTDRHGLVSYDWSNLLDDREFRDWAHVTEDGHRIVSSVFFDMLPLEGLNE